MSEQSLPRCEFASKDLILRIDMTVSGEVTEIDPVVERIMGAVKQMECAAGKELDVQLSLQEALANAVVHGCNRDPGKQVRVQVGCDEGRGMLIVISDPGTGFDPEEVPSPLVGENVFSSHGRGIFLINQLMDHVQFRKGGTEIWMRKS
jgi:serine/threonine-protein kinase RsbW